ncbi:hypothetical protein LHYA1_G008648 [Lachnellula hyalina]|uniref:Isopenicillin N synthase-like Fe(2+) 2OG dioxygenase domain-containing protein n=1 Tax=Lachnellula hyalina TaxID=1316788 RepID=A0A8H8QUI0_9HELO|nr:uncharacterized protein LHYA1_G008648 [Lachnellula hyalina]TVY22356.1 hypothetical protein LHYA1_G008648 [Lachnellula hyalina]
MPFLSTIKSIGSSIIPRRHKQPPDSQEQSLRAEEQADVPYSLPPLKVVNLPLVLPEHQFALSDQGWTKITYQTPVEKDALYGSAQALFQASKSFFDLPTAQKHAFKTKEGSEEGWSFVEGEKEFITLRSLDNTPPELLEAARTFWAVAGDLLNDQLGRVAESLELPAEALDVYSKPCSRLSMEKTATMLRLFRYEGFEQNQPKTVAEPHRDLGLLSLVIGDKPGLEVWDRHAQSWFPIEKSFESPAGSILAGRQLERLTNSRYRSGGHLVRSYPSSSLNNP